MDANVWTQFILRWFHFLAGITWIGLLYYFNLVNVNFMKSLDAPTVNKVVPELMPRALFWFRWGAVATWLTGLIYYALIITGEGGNHGKALGLWLVLWLVTWGVIYFLLQPLSGALNKGIVIGIIVAVLVAAMSFVLVKAAGDDGLKSNRSISIGIGGGIGTLMLLNVWGIIWPHNKRIIAWRTEARDKGTPMPEEAKKLARRAFLASRMNTWLSVAMLWFMGMASHLPLFPASNLP